MLISYIRTTPDDVVLEQKDVLENHTKESARKFHVAAGLIDVLDECDCSDCLRR